MLLVGMRALLICIAHSAAVAMVTVLAWESADYLNLWASAVEPWSINIEPTVSNYGEVHSAQSMSTLLSNGVTTADYDPRISVFYHVYQGNDTLTRGVWHEQLETILAFGSNVSNLFYTTVGGQADRTYDCPFCHMAQHLEHGFEESTLQLLFDHCSARRSETVAYIHAKGSFHPSEANDAYRRFVMSGVFSKQCLNMPPSCNICGSRFSAIPHHHVPGNMWVAKCEYIRRLIPPSAFAGEMDRMKLSCSDIELASCSPYCKRVLESKFDWKVGAGRYAAEHWVASHPTVQPCDVYAGPYRRGRDSAPPGGWAPDLSPAPRFGIAADADKNGIWNWRLMEWRKLYNASPEVNHWSNTYYRGFR